MNLLDLANRRNGLLDDGQGGQVDLAKILEGALDVVAAEVVTTGKKPNAPTVDADASDRAYVATIMKNPDQQSEYWVRYLLGVYHEASEATLASAAQTKETVLTKVREGWPIFAE